MRICLLLWVLALPALAGERLVVGRGGLPWPEVQESARFAQVAEDSLWLWPSAPGENLGPGALARGGSIRAVVIENEIPRVVDSPALARLLDGDEGTAFDPDEEGLPRQLELYLDLGGVFRLGRVRLFPRLDASHRQRFPQAFTLGLEGGSDAYFGQLFHLAFFGQGPPATDPTASLSRYPYTPLLNFTPAKPNGKSLVDWPGIQQVTGIRQARYLRLANALNLPWELAELELYSDGTVPEAEFVSKPLLAGGEAVWGRVQYEGGDLSRLPVVLQVRTGPDEEPLHYFILVGEREVQVSREAWEVIESIEGAAVKGPVRPNPGWSTWQAAEEGIVRAGGPNPYLQFRLRLLQPGVKIERLVFEYDTRPLARALRAEISPLAAAAGEETAFTLWAVLETGEGDTGLRYLQVLTPAELAGVDSVRVDGAPVVHTLAAQPGRGFTLNLWERLLKDGSLVQVFFRARIFADGTPFALRGLDRRLAAGAIDTAYQYAGEEDIDPASLGAGLVVRLATVENPVLAPLRPGAAFFTPNGDGVNDFFALGYDLLKLTRPAPVRLRVYDLGGRLLRQGAGREQSGGFARLWDGRDEYGGLVPPGLYLYQLEVQADEGTERRQGVVGVGY
jgi:hypothetical protein